MNTIDGYPTPVGMVSSGRRRTDGVGDAHHLDHLPDPVDADDVGAAEHRGGYRGGSRPVALVRRQRPP